MMRTRTFGITPSVGTTMRGITGVAPILYFPPTTSKLPREDQIKRNTNVALELVRRFKGPAPQPYVRRHTATFETTQKQIDSLLASADKIRKPLTNDMPMDKISVIERCLKHGLWMYLKEDGNTNYGEMEKWIVYTPNDETQFALFKRAADQKERFAALKKKKQDAGLPDACLPRFDWSQEYRDVIDREVVVEKRLRYDTLAANTTERNEAEIEELLKKYRKPEQDKRLDSLVDQLENLKPVIAREAIAQRLAIKHLEGQLGVWRYLDWNPEIRDRAEIETDTGHTGWWYVSEEKRCAQMRLRSRNEVVAVMEQKQAELAAKTQSVGTAVSTTNAAREKLLREVLHLQSRIGKKDDEEKKEAPKAAAGHH